jgi:hypothetical protein
MCQCKLGNLGNFWTWIFEKLLDLDVLPRLDHSDFVQGESFFDTTNWCFIVEHLTRSPSQYQMQRKNKAAVKLLEFCDTRTPHLITFFWLRFFL